MQKSWNFTQTCLENYYLVIFLFFVLYTIDIQAQAVYNMSEDSVTNCSGVLYDSGGGDGSYGNDEDLLFTICPMPTPICIQAEIINFKTEIDWDKLTIYDGNDVDGRVLASLTSVLEEGTVQANSGCISFHFTSDDSNVEGGWQIKWQCFNDTCPQIEPSSQDCLNAIAICQNIYTEDNAYTGTGNILNEINGEESCLNSGEKNNVWYTFTVLEDGLLNFSITPNNLLDDYDWAVFNITNNNCSEIFDMPTLEVACNYSGATGITGANGLTNSEQNEPPIPVQAGETYAVNVSQFTASVNGYELTFEQSSAVIFDDVPPKLERVIPPTDCGGSLVSIHTTENVLCNSLSNNSLQILGEGGPYSLFNINSNACKVNGASYDRFFTAIVNPPLTINGEYMLIAQTDLVDLCGNTTVIDTLLFDFDVAPAFTGVVDDVIVCSGDDPTVSVQGNGNYRFYNSNGVAPENLLATGTSFNPMNLLQEDNTLELYITEIDNICESEPQRVLVRVSTLENPNFSIDGQVCLSQNADNPTAVLAQNATPNGIFSIVPNTASINVQTGEIDKNTLMPDMNYSVTYTTPNIGCQDSESHSFSVQVAPDITFNNISTGTSYCSDDSPIALNISPTGGTLTGSGVVNNSRFDPAQANFGTNILVYQVDSEQNDCAIMDSIVVEVVPTPMATFTIKDTLDIGEETQILFTGSALPTATFEWELDGAQILDSSEDMQAFSVSWPTLGERRISLTVMNGSNCVATEMRTIQVGIQNAVLIPTAFSPNDDNLNDRFAIKVRNLSTFSLTIYNRWGKIMYQSTNIDEQGWDGTFNNIPQAIGNYMYQVAVTYNNGESKFKQGTLMLLR